MKNKILEKEIADNTQINEIFTHQSARDLEKTALYIKENYPQDLCVHFSSFMWGHLPRLLSTYPQHHLVIWEQYVASKVLEQLQSQYSRSEQSFLNLRDQDLEDLKQLMFLSQDEAAFKLLRVDQAQSRRIHFVMNGINDETLCQAISSYLSDDIPQTTMIYTNSDIYLQDKSSCWDEYDYVVFDGSKEGVPSQYRSQKIKKLNQ